MLKELKISNFRCFDDEVTVRFAPITVLIGKNNSGKSSIIKFLLMLQQSLSEDSTRFFNSRGGKANLGDFRSLKNSLTDKNEMTFNLVTSEHQTRTTALDDYLDRRAPDSVKSDILFATTATLSYDKAKQVQKHEVILLRKQEELSVRSQYLSDKPTFLNFSEEFATEKTSDAEESQVGQAIVHVLKHNIRDLVHLAAARSAIPEKGVITADPPIRSVGKDGEYTLPYLQKIIESGGDELMRRSIEAVAGIGHIEFRPYTESTTECFAKNSSTGAEVRLEDFGFGVRLCFPTIVQGIMMKANDTLMVEEPEAQIHPTAQLEMGQFFADLWQERKVGSIIETHSDNILLRLRRLISNGKLDASDVTVAFLDIEDGKTIVKNLSIENDGTMEDGLPMEFFHKHIWESMEMGNVE